MDSLREEWLRLPKFIDVYTKVVSQFTKRGKRNITLSLFYPRHMNSRVIVDIFLREILLSSQLFQPIRKGQQ
jgi:preprotein translocase subunit Sec63